jgi:hypothetical protein
MVTEALRGPTAAQKHHDFVKAPGRQSVLNRAFDQKGGNALLPGRNDKNYVFFYISQISNGREETTFDFSYFHIFIKSDFRILRPLSILRA